MILIKGTLINEEKLLNAYSVGGDKTNLHFVSAEGNIQTTSITPSDIYKAIENKKRVNQIDGSEIESLKKELKDTETLLIHANTENERLRMLIDRYNKYTSMQPEIDCDKAQKCDEGCLGFKQISNVTFDECVNKTQKVAVTVQACKDCEKFIGFCDPAESNEENGCSGRQLPTGEMYIKCRSCIGLDSKE